MEQAAEVEPQFDRLLDEVQERLVQPVVQVGRGPRSPRPESGPFRASGVPREGVTPPDRTGLCRGSTGLGRSPVG